MNKQATLSIAILIVIIVLSFFIGTWFAGNKQEPASFKYKYDSLKRIVTSQREIMIINEKEKAVLRDRDRNLKDKEDSLSKAKIQQDNFYKEKHDELNKKWLAMSSSDLSREMTEEFEKAHPAPLFPGESVDTVKSVAIAKPIAVHFLERNDFAKGLSADLGTTKAELKLSQSRVINLNELVDKQKADSVAQETIISSQVATIDTKNEEMTAKDKLYKKELRKQKVQKIAAGVIAVAATWIAISASIH